MAVPKSKRSKAVCKYRRSLQIINKLNKNNLFNKKVTNIHIPKKYVIKHLNLYYLKKEFKKINFFKFKDQFKKIY